MSCWATTGYQIVFQTAAMQPLTCDSGVPECPGTSNVDTAEFYFVFGVAFPH